MSALNTYHEEYLNHLTTQISASSLAQGRVTLLHDQLNALSTQSATFPNVFKMTLKHVVANISDLVENVIRPMGQKKVRNMYSVLTND